MPCNCVLDLPKYPQNEEWGPLVWSILHTLAEKAGKQTSPITRGDEQRAWPLFMKALVPVIPCPFCRTHFDDYLKQYPFELPLDHTAWNDFVRDYFYTFHESVNARLQKPSFPNDQLSLHYNNINTLKEILARLQTIQDRAINMGGISLLNWRAWLKQYNMLRAAIA